MKTSLRRFLFSAFFLCAISFTHVFSQNASTTIKFGTFKIDGDTSDWVGYEWYPFLYPNGIIDEADLSPKFKMSWDRNKLYMLFKVKDQTINTENSSPWMKDGMEISCNFPPNVRKKIIVWCGATLEDLITNSGTTAIDADNSDGFAIETDTLSDGYILEFSIPYETFIYTTSSFNPSDGNKFTMEIWVNDSDDGTDRDRTSWADCSSINNTPSEYDTIILSALTNPKNIEIEPAKATIDGDFGEWSLVPNNLVQNPVSGKVSNLQDLSSGMKATWDSENLYVYVTAFDSLETLHAEDTLDWNNKDAIQIALNLKDDANYDVLSGSNNDEALIVIPYNADQTLIESSSKNVTSWTGFECSMVTNFSELDEESFRVLWGYAIECKIPFANIWPDFVAGDNVAFDMEINVVDNDNGFNETEAIIAWSGIADITNDKSGFGKVTLTGTPPTAINEAEMSNISVYPNPASTTLFVKGNIRQAEMYDITGHLLSVSANEATDMVSFNISNLSSGIYILKTTDTQNVTVSHKIIVK